MAHNKNHMAFDLMKNATRGNMLRRKDPMMGTREAPGSDQMYLGNPNVDPGAGQAQSGPGFGRGALTASIYGNFSPYSDNINNMNDLYDFYISQSHDGGFFDQYETFQDFLYGQSSQGPEHTADLGQQFQYQQPQPGIQGGFVDAGMSSGSAIGGAGDIGFGNVFMGGLQGTEGFALNEPDTSIIDPSVDQQCLAAFQTYGEEYDSYEEFANAMC
jgi:hypothetical protein